jgi:hypothetical protein
MKMAEERGLLDSKKVPVRRESSMSTGESFSKRTYVPDQLPPTSRGSNSLTHFSA